MRKEVTEILKEITPNVFQDYPTEAKNFPCLIYSLTMVGVPELEDIGYFDCSLRVEIYSESSEERSELELKLIRTLIKHGWINYSNTELPHPDYYRQNLMFSTIK
ncbi:MAG: hypothetical protein RR565_04725 [Erysipelothrix sp.]